MIRANKSFKLTTNDEQTKFLFERLSNTEKFFSELCSTFATYTRKTARLRDKNDDLAKLLKTHAENEQYNDTLSTGLSNFSKALVLVSDFQDIEVQRLEVKIINELSQYETICKTVRDELKVIAVLREKGISKKKQLEELRQKNSRDRKKLPMKESDILKANMEYSRTNKEMIEVATDFEEKKLKDLKTLLKDFIQIEMKKHVKIIEVLSAAFQDISDIDVANDTEDFKKKLQEDENTEELLDESNTSNLQSKSRSMGSLASLFNTSSVSRQRVLTSQSITSLNTQSNSPKLKKDKIVKNTKKIDKDLLTNSSSVDSDQDDEEDDDDEEEDNIAPATVDKKLNDINNKKLHEINNKKLNEINNKKINEKKLQTNPQLPYVRRLR